MFDKLTRSHVVNGFFIYMAGMGYHIWRLFNESDNSFVLVPNNIVQLNASRPSTPCVLYIQSWCCFFNRFEAMELKMLKPLVTIFLCALVTNLSVATDYIVGGPNGNGWSQSTDFQTWASSITFLQGDNLGQLLLYSYYYPQFQFQSIVIQPN